MRSLTATVLLGFCAATTQAQGAPDSWVPISVRDSSALALDTARVAVTRDDSRLVWTRLSYHSGGTIGRGSNAIRFAYVLTRMEIDCSLRRMRLHSATYYAADRSVIESTDFEPDYGSWTDIPPETSGDIIAAIICEAK